MVSRPERLAKEIRYAVGDFLIHSAPEECNGAMLTVSHVELTQDLKEARIFVSVYTLSGCLDRAQGENTP